MAPLDHFYLSLLPEEKVILMVFIALFVGSCVSENKQQIFIDIFSHFPLSGEAIKREMWH